ncbi:MAG: hypothetical protein Kow0074_16210 [Candidatus Zixiibacteriota bacterium]
MPILYLLALLTGYQSSAWGIDDPEGRYVWPLEGYETLSSGFCDYRLNHYHGGIDVSVNGRVGIPVRAADSGYVLRVTTSYWGYGKGLYIKMADGRIAVYGHLSEFAPEIQEFVESNQYAARRYNQNLWPAPGQIPVARGQIIARTGQTGAGPPHLHFEIRTADNRPLNPLAFGFEKDDATAPVIHSITLTPNQPVDAVRTVSLVDGFPVPKTFGITKTGTGWGIDGTPTISGAVGVAVKTSDVVDSPKYTHSTYACRVYLNDVLFAEVRHDSFDYSDTRLINLEREYDGKPGYAERAVQMFRLPGNRLWHYTTLVNDGWIEIGESALPGTNDVRIEAEDVAGNVTSITFQLIAHGEPSESAPGDPAAGSTGALSIAATDWAIGGLALRIEGINSAPLCYADPGRGISLPVGRSSASGWYAWVPAETVADTIWIVLSDSLAPVDLGWQGVSSLDGGEIVATDGNAKARFTPGDLYYSSYFRFEPRPVPLKSSFAASAMYELSPENVPFAHTARLSIESNRPEKLSKTAIYRYRPSNQSWSFIGADLVDGERIAGDIDFPGSFVLLVDDDPPVIRNVIPGRGQTTRDRQPTVTFEMFDALAGIGSDADVVLTIDGEWTPVEYDVDTYDAKARPRYPLDVGEHRVEISVKDRVGNEETFLRILRIVN